MMEKNSFNKIKKEKISNDIAWIPYIHLLCFFNFFRIEIVCIFHWMCPISFISSSMMLQLFQVIYCSIFVHHKMTNGKIQPVQFKSDILCWINLSCHSLQIHFGSLWLSFSFHHREFLFRSPSFVLSDFLF